MNEYSVVFLNGITKHIEANDWKDSIIEARIIAERNGFSPKIKYIMDGEGVLIKNINEESLEFNYGELKINV